MYINYSHHNQYSGVTFIFETNGQQLRSIEAPHVPIHCRGSSFWHVIQVIQFNCFLLQQKATHGRHQQQKSRSHSLRLVWRVKKKGRSISTLAAPLFIYFARFHLGLLSSLFTLGWWWLFNWIWLDPKFLHNWLLLFYYLPNIAVLVLPLLFHLI